MKLPLSWLKTFIQLDESPEEIAEILTLAGLEVDAINRTPFTFEGVIVAKVIKSEPHPDAEKLSVATVSDGKEEFQVVCGASNCRAGLTTAFAPVGAVLRDEKDQPFKIKKAKLRGVHSFGMLCAEDELGLALKSDGIAELGDSFEVGQRLDHALSDTIFDISLTPNLGHCTSVLGIARELGALLDRKVTLPTFSLSESDEKTALTVDVKDKESCPRYLAREIKNVKVGPSPEWLSGRLESSGIRSINNIVDVTNYVMLELGQPMHAFDRNKLTGGISVDHAKKATKLQTLDGEIRTVPENTLLILDDKGPIAVAGVMGGEESAVSDETSAIVLEAAVFDSSSVRRSMKALGLRTESSGRFEKGVDPEMCVLAIDYAASLIEGTLLSGKIEAGAGEVKPKKLSVRLKRVHQVLGAPITFNEMEAIFKRLDFQIAASNGETLSLIIPTYRGDITAEIDLIEEVARIYGYNNIEKSQPRVHISPQFHSPMYLFEGKVRRKLISEGLQEFVTCDLISPQLAKLSMDEGFDENSLIKVLRPSSIDQSILRLSLLPGHLQALKRNQDFGASNISAFEIGRIHMKEGDDYLEPHTAAITLAGKEHPHHAVDKPAPVDFFMLKGMVENLFEGLGIKAPEFRKSSKNSYHPHKQAEIYLGKQLIGVLGQVHPKLLRDQDLTSPVFFAEFNLDCLLKRHGKLVQMKPLPLYPGSTRDWTLTLKKEQPIGDVLAAVRKASSPLLKEVQLVDIFESEKIGSDVKNVTLRFLYRDDQKTVQQGSVEAAHTKLIEKVLKETFL